MIPDETIAEVRKRADIVAVVGRYVDLKKAGTLFKACCPFHDEKTPSFTVSPTRNTYHCFGCGVHGDALRFISEHDALPFPDAVRSLAGQLGIEVPEDRAERPEERAARAERRSLQARLLAAQDKITAFYSEGLFGPAGRPARAYLQERGITPRAAEAFRLGWASGDKAAFDTFATAQGLERDDLVTLGLLVAPEQGFVDGERLGGGYLRFRERVMFPVVDLRGEVVGFSGRILDPHKKAAKYINSPETPVFTKGEHLYGAHTARHAARRSGRLVLCEGNVDVVMLWQAGLEGTAAAMGTALTSTQVRLVKRLSEQVVCVMDGDAAGTKAAFSSLVPFLEAGLQPRAVMLPPGEDPDSFVRGQGVEAFVALLDAAAPLLDLHIVRVDAQHPADPPGRIAALRALAPALAGLDDPLAFTLYRDAVGATLGLGVDLVDRAVADQRRDAAASAARRAPVEEPPKVEVRREPPRRRSPDRAATPAPVEEEWLPPEPPPRVFEDAPPPFDAATYDASFEMALVAGPIAATRGDPDPAVGQPPKPLGYVREVIEFIVQYPMLAVRLRDAEAHNSLTHDGLAGFVDDLCREVEAGRTPNVDRLLSNLQHPGVVAFLRECQARRPSLNDDTVDQAFDDAVQRLRVGAQKEEKVRLTQAMSAAWATKDHGALAALNEQLTAVHARLRRLQTPNVEGAR